MYVVFKSDQKIHMCENFQVTSVYNVEKPWLWFIVRNGGVDTPYVLMFILQKKKKEGFDQFQYYLRIQFDWYMWITSPTSSYHYFSNG